MDQGKHSIKNFHLFFFVAKAYKKGDHRT